MSTELLRYDNIGSKDGIKALIKKILSPTQFRSIKNVKRIFLDTDRWFVNSFDGTIALLRFLSLVVVKNDKIKINRKAWRGLHDIDSDPVFYDNIIFPLFERLKKHNLLFDFISPDNIKYDFSRDNIILSRSLIPLKFSGLRNFLIDVGAGYDIASFDSIYSESIDRFIEVKSYSQNVSFYWSRNEVETARLKGDSYFLYLVNRDCITNNGYEPLVIQNAYSNVFIDEGWRKEGQSWFISPKPLPNSK